MAVPSASPDRNRKRRRGRRVLRRSQARAQPLRPAQDCTIPGGERSYRQRRWQWGRRRWKWWGGGDQAQGRGGTGVLLALGIAGRCEEVVAALVKADERPSGGRGPWKKRKKHVELSTYGECVYSGCVWLRRAQSGWLIWAWLGDEDDEEDENGEYASRVSGAAGE